MKIDSRIEMIFSHAVAMDQSGRLRNTIYIENKNVYVVNSDNTVLLKFTLPSSANPFKNPISFKASDYDSNMFYEKNNKIVFETKFDDLTKKKSCGTPYLTPNKIIEIYHDFSPLKLNKVHLNKNIISLLDENLSHIEISSKNKQLKIIQRNIYDGTIIEITKNEKGFGISEDKIKTNFGPVGLRTNDFIALFSFNENLTFSFSKNKNKGYCRVLGRNFKMSGIISLCLYDELGTITDSKE